MRRVLLALVCASSLWLTATAFAQDGVGAAQEGICCGADCCLIDGQCLGMGDTNPTNSCQVCDPSQSQAAWTNMSGCAQPDAGTPPTPDAGTPTPDAGTTPPSGGGCSVAQPGAPGLAALLALVGAAFFVRRRR